MDTHMQTQNNEREASTAVGGPQAMCVCICFESVIVYEEAALAMILPELRLRLAMMKAKHRR